MKLLLASGFAFLLLTSCKKDLTDKSDEPRLPEDVTANLSDMDFDPAFIASVRGGSFSYYDEKGAYFIVSYRRVSKGDENAEIVFSTDDLINPTTSKNVQAQIQETVAYTHNNPCTVTVTFKDTATIKETLGAKRLTLISRDTTTASFYLGNGYIEQQYLADIRKSAAAFKNIIVLTNDIQPLIPGDQRTPFWVEIIKL